MNSSMTSTEKTRPGLLSQYCAKLRQTESNLEIVLSLYFNSSSFALSCVTTSLGSKVSGHEYSMSDIPPVKMSDIHRQIHHWGLCEENQYPICSYTTLTVIFLNISRIIKLCYAQFRQNQLLSSGIN